MHTFTVDQFLYQEDGSVKLRFHIPGQDADLALHLTRENIAQLMQQTPNLFCNLTEVPEWWQTFANVSVVDEAMETPLGHFARPILATLSEESYPDPRYQTYSEDADQGNDDRR